MTIENTSERDPALHLLGMMGGGQSEYIEEMEARGARQVVASDKIPTDAPWARLAELGFVRGDAVYGDELFTHVKLPEGWRREGTGHSMHTDIVDERGVPRVGIFYKAAFYDRRADAHIISIAAKLTTSVLYGDGPAVLPELWPVLTDEERADFIASVGSSLAHYRETIENYPGLNAKGDYTNRIARGETVLALT